MLNTTGNHQNGSFQLSSVFLSCTTVGKKTNNNQKAALVTESEKKGLNKLIHLL